MGKQPKKKRSVPSSRSKANELPLEAMARDLVKRGLASNWILQPKKSDR